MVLAVLRVALVAASSREKDVMAHLNGKIFCTHHDVADFNETYQGKSGYKSTQDTSVKGPEDLVHFVWQTFKPKGRKGLETLPLQRTWTRHVMP